MASPKSGEREPWSDETVLRLHRFLDVELYPNDGSCAIPGSNEIRTLL